MNSKSIKNIDITGRKNISKIVPEQLDTQRKEASKFDFKQQGPLPQGSIGRKVTTGRQSRATHESMHATCSPGAAQ